MSPTDDLPPGLRRLRLQAREAAAKVRTMSRVGSDECADAASDVWEAEVRRLRGALETLRSYDDALRVSNWSGLANVVRDALDNGEPTAPSRGVE